MTLLESLLALADRIEEAHGKPIAIDPKAATALNQAIAEAKKQEPVAWLTGCPQCGMNECDCADDWVSLTDEQIDELSRTMVKGDKSVNWLCRAIEAKLKEKNT